MLIHSNFSWFGKYLEPNLYLNCECQYYYFLMTCTNVFFLPIDQSDGFPTILFFPAGNKSFDPVSCVFLYCFYKSTVSSRNKANKNYLASGVYRSM